MYETLLKLIEKMKRNSLHNFLEFFTFAWWILIYKCQKEELTFLFWLVIFWTIN
jgi:hypothetical protein